MQEKVLVVLRAGCWKELVLGVLGVLKVLGVRRNCYTPSDSR
jgi:hypothetical protein